MQTATGILLLQFADTQKLVGVEIVRLYPERKIFQPDICGIGTIGVAVSQLVNVSSRRKKLHVTPLFSGLDLKYIVPADYPLPFLNLFGRLTLPFADEVTDPVDRKM